MHLKCFAVDRHEVGSESWCDPAQFAAESKEFGWVGRSEPKRVCYRNTQQMHAIAHSARHIEASSGETAVWPRAAAITDADGVAVELKCRACAADRRHRIRHQNWATATTLGRKRIVLADHDPGAGAP